MPTLCVSVPGGRADDHDRTADVLGGEHFDLVLAHVLDVEALVAQGGVVDGCVHSPNITKYV